MAAIIWPVVGIMLSYRGLNWIVGSGSYWLVVVGLAVGGLKSYFVLDRTAKKGIDRILRFGDNTCVGAVYSIRTWGMVLAMMAIGMFFRSSSLPAQLLGVLYLAIGWGLIMSSRHAWFSWYRLVAKDIEKKDCRDFGDDD